MNEGTHRVTPPQKGEHHTQPEDNADTSRARKRQAITMVAKRNQAPDMVEQVIKQWGSPEVTQSESATYNLNAALHRIREVGAYLLSNSIWF